jgi:hypothetical protein
MSANQSATTVVSTPELYQYINNIVKLLLCVLLLTPVQLKRRLYSIIDKTDWAPLPFKAKMVR